MSDLVTIFGTLEAIFLGMSLLFFIVENERLPGTWRHWAPAQWTDSYSRSEGTLIIGIRRRNDKIPLATLNPASPSFDEDLIAAEEKVRGRCIALNTSNRTLRKKLPR